MEKTLNILKIGILIALLSCEIPNEKKVANLATTDTLKVVIDQKEKKRIKNTKEIEKQNFTDSLRISKILLDALNIANQNIEKNKFIEKYEISPDSIPINVEINLDYHFTKNHTHLIIKRREPSTLYINIYSKSDNRFKEVISHKQWLLTYVNDTIGDINGDGLNDFTVNWYGSTGCCLKAFSDVYLLRQDKTFSENFEFINPTFSPNERIIRGICYGNPGETEIYKYKWNGESVDTLEYISNERNKKGKTGKIIISTDRPYGEKYKILKTLNSVPKEYIKIKGYDWFTGNGYE